jgi:hypothetical protein
MCGGLMLSGGALWFIPSAFDLFSTWEMEQLQRSLVVTGTSAHGDAFQQQRQSDGSDTQTESPEAKTRGDQIDIAIANAKIPFH